MEKRNCRCDEESRNAEQENDGSLQWYANKGKMKKKHDDALLKIHVYNNCIAIDLCKKTESDETRNKA